MTPPDSDNIVTPLYEDLEAPELTDLDNWIKFLAKTHHYSPEEYIRFLFTAACVQYEDVWAESPLFSHHLKMALDKGFEGILDDYFIVEVVKTSQFYVKLCKQDVKYEAKIKKLVPSNTLGHHQYWITGKKS